ncbi:MAG TPA: hypothetical protein VMX16_04590 [Terriglobia bacterium]|nr:hypothetical protein [Terriglobia bacterium]
MTISDPAVPIRTITAYAERIIPEYYELRLELAALKDALFAKAPDVKKEFERRYQDAKKQQAKSTGPAAIATMLQSVHQLGEVLQQLSQSQKAD